MKLIMFRKVFLRGIEEACPSKRWKGASVSESALHTFDGDKPNSVAPRKRSRPDDHSSRLTFVNRPATAIRRSQTATTVAVVRRYPRILSGRLPFSVLSCTAWGFSCLANRFASGELLPRLFTLACAFL